MVDGDSDQYDDIETTEMPVSLQKFERSCSKEKLGRSESIVSDTSPSQQSVVRRQTLWDQRFEEVEKHETQLVMTQWNMMREQLTALTSELAEVHAHFDEFIISTEKTHDIFKKQMQGMEHDLTQERIHREAGDDALEKTVQELRKLLGEESEAREEADQRLKAELTKRLTSVDRVLSERGRDEAELRQELTLVHSSFDLLSKKVTPLPDMLQQETKDRKTLEDTLRAAFHDEVEALKRKLSEQNEHVEAQIRDLTDSVQTESDDRGSGDKKLEDLLKKMQGTVQGLSDQLPDMKTAIKELDQTLHPRLNEHKKTIDRNFVEHKEGHSRLEQRIDDLTKKIEAEVNARSSLQGDMDQMIDALRSKLRTTIQQQFDVAVTKVDNLSDALQAQIENEKTAREDRDSTLDKAIQDLKGNLASKLDDLQALLTKVDTELRQEVTAVDKDLKETLARLAESLSKQIATLVECLGMSISEDDMTFSSIITSADEQCDDLGRLFKDVGDRFVQQYTLPRRKVVTSRRASKQIILELTNAARDVKLAAFKADVIKTLPALSRESKAIIDDVIARDRVDLILKRGDGSVVQHSGGPEQINVAHVHLKEAVEFESVLHGKPPEAVFKDESLVSNLLGDVADILGVYKTATVLIEASTVTSSDELDSWAHELATNRAEKIKDALASIGVDEKRLNAVGVPDNMGDKRPGVTVKIISF